MTELRQKIVARMRALHPAAILVGTNELPPHGFCNSPRHNVRAFAAYEGDKIVTIIATDNDSADDGFRMIAATSGIEVGDGT